MLAIKDFERDLADLTPAKFEQLVFAIVRKEHATAQSLKAPDFGADVLDDPAARSPRVWQVKHYPGDIHWSDCTKSLDRAVGKWRPAKITFVFPRDLTGKEHQDFTDKLVGRKPTPVKLWTASELNAALERYPAIRRSFFPHRTDVLHQVLRAARLTEEPIDGPAFLEHGLRLAELAEELDPNFDYELTSRPERLSRPFSGATPFMQVTVLRDGQQSILAAWAKPEAEPATASWSFTEDEAGDEACRIVHRALASGEPVDLTAGFAVRTSPTPTAIAKVLDQADDWGGGTLQVMPSVETVPLDLSIPTNSSMSALHFEMRAAPPRAGHDGAWVGLASGVLLYVGFEDHGDSKVTLHISPTLELGPVAGPNALAVATVRDMLAGEVQLSSALVGGKASIDLSQGLEPEDADRLAYLADVYAALIEIEARTDVALQLPTSIGIENATAALNLVLLLRTGHATGRSHLKTTLHAPGAQAVALATRLASTRQIAVPFEQDLLDQTIRFRWARLTFERFKATVGPLSPDGHAGIHIDANGDIELDLIEEPLPSDVALDIATGAWKSAILT